MEVTIEALKSSADKYAEEAESTGILELIAQSNSYWRFAKEKLKDLNAINSEIRVLEQQLKSIM